MKNLLSSLSFFALMLSGLSAVSQESVMLKYGMKEGDRFLQNMEITQNTMQSVMGQEVKVLGEISGVSHLLVEAVTAEGNTTALLTVGELTVHQAAMGKDTTITLKDIKESSRIVVSPNGKVISSARVDSSEVAALVNQMEPGRLRSLPGKEVKVGESWSESYTETKNSTPGTPFGLEMAIENEYTLVGRESREGKEYFKITSTGTIAVTGKGEQAGMEMFVEGNAKVAGYSLFDPELSMVVYTEDDTEMELNVAISGPQNMTVPMTQSIKTITRFSKE